MWADFARLSTERMSRLLTASEQQDTVITSSLVN